MEAGDEVSDRFDPMLAKIVAHGSDRAEAMKRLTAALDETIVLGLTTNLRFLRWLVREPAVTSGQARIDTLERIWPPDDWLGRTAIPDAAWSMAARLLGSGGWRLNGPRTIRLVADGTERVVALPDEPSATTTAGAETAAAVVAGDTAHLDLGGRSVGLSSCPTA